MLYQPPDGPAPVRLQGAHVSDQEIERLVEFWKRSPLHVGVEAVPQEEFVAAEKAAGEADDELLQEAIQVVRKFRTASVTLLQRHLRIGYARAARVMDQLEERGVVGPPDGSKQRPVLLTDEE
jgi:S-DNA-T family DNA segregation ATPase FtsK/SpoIIIE